MNDERNPAKKSDTTGSSEPNPKLTKSSKRRSKPRTKVWEKVAWFTRKTKQGKESKPSCSPVVSNKENKTPNLPELVVEDAFSRDARKSEVNNSRYRSISKTKQKLGVRKSGSFNYLRRRKLKHFDKNISSAVVEETACPTATGTFHDFVSERKAARHHQSNERLASSHCVLVGEMAREINFMNRETTKGTLSQPMSSLSLSDGHNRVSQSCHSFSTAALDSSFARSRSLSIPGYGCNSWPRKKRSLVEQKKTELLSPPLKQKRISGLRKTATFSGFDASKINISDFNSFKRDQRLAKSTPLLAENKHNQIKNQNGITVGVIHFFKSPSKNGVETVEKLTNKSKHGGLHVQRNTEAISANELEKVDLSSTSEQCERGSASEELCKEFEIAKAVCSTAEMHDADLKAQWFESVDNLQKENKCIRESPIYQVKKINGLDGAKGLVMGSSLGAVATMKECFVVEDDPEEFDTVSYNDTLQNPQTLAKENSNVDCLNGNQNGNQNVSLVLQDTSDHIDALIKNTKTLHETHTGSMQHTSFQNSITSSKSSNTSLNNTSLSNERRASCSSLDVIKEVPDSRHVSDNLELSKQSNESWGDAANNQTEGGSGMDTEKKEISSLTEDEYIGNTHFPVNKPLPLSSQQAYTPNAANDVTLKNKDVMQQTISPENNWLSQKEKLISSCRPKVDGPVFKEQTEAFLQWFHKFNDEQKNIIIRRMLESCQLPQMHLLSVLMEPVLHKACPSNCQDMLAWLPHNITSAIMSYIDPVSLCRCSQVNRLWNHLASNPVLWQKLCSNDEWQMSRISEKKQFERNTLPSGTIQWKKMFAERFLLRRNWLNGRCKVRTFEGHTQGISCVQFDDTRIVSGSSDKTIKVWDLSRDDAGAVLTLAGHSGTVRCLNLNGNRLVSGSVDRSIKVWDLSFESYWSGASCKVTMVGHMHTVRCLQVDDEKVVSGSYDKTLKVWDIKTGHCKLTLRGHNAAVLCVQFDDSKIVSGSYDNTIKVWSLDEGSCLMTLTGHHDAVTCLNLTPDGRKVISGSLDHNLKFWDLATGKCIGTLDWIRSEGHTGVVRCLQSDSWRIVSAGDDKTLKMWSLESGQRLLTLRCHTDGVTCLQFNDYRIVSGSYDKTVKVWNFSPLHEFLSPG